MLLHINEAGLELIKHYEGWRSSPYLCSAARATIGWGSTWDRKCAMLSYPWVAA